MANRRLTQNLQTGTISLQVEKGLAGIGVLSVCRRLISRAIGAALFMVRRMGAPLGAPLPTGGNANPVRLATRDWRLLWLVLKPIVGGSFVAIHSPCLNLVDTAAIDTALDIATDAVALEGLTLALHIVVTDYLSDRRIEKCNALDALADALHQKSQLLARDIGAIGVTLNA